MSAKVGSFPSGRPNAPVAAPSHGPTVVPVGTAKDPAAPTAATLAGGKTRKAQSLHADGTGPVPKTAVDGGAGSPHQAGRAMRAPAACRRGSGPLSRPWSAGGRVTGRGPGYAWGCPAPAFAGRGGWDGRRGSQEGHRGGGGRVPRPQPHDGPGDGRPRGAQGGEVRRRGTHPPRGGGAHRTRGRPVNRRPPNGRPGLPSCT